MCGRKMMSRPCQLQGQQKTECLRIPAPNPRWQAGHREGWFAAEWHHYGLTQQLLFLRKESCQELKTPHKFSLPMQQKQRKYGDSGVGAWRMQWDEHWLFSKTNFWKWGSESRAWSFWGFFIQHSVGQDIFFQFHFVAFYFLCYLFISLYFLIPHFIYFVKWNLEISIK